MASNSLARDVTMPPFGEWLTGFALEPDIEDDEYEITPELDVLADRIVDRILARLKENEDATDS